jgi:glycosyltransferase involved in cell wall biosynthesis
MSKPKISIIMAVYNSEKFLSKAIESILNQTFKDFEFIIIDDASKDNSLNIIKEYAKKDERIKTIFNKINIGLTKSLNLGIKQAKGKYIARMDDDDISLPKRLEIQYNYLQKHSNIELLGSGILMIDSKGNELIKVFGISNQSKLYSRLQKKNCINHPVIMFKNNGNRYRDKFVYSQDYDLYLRFLTEKKKIASLSEPLLKYRINPDAISFSKRSEQTLFSQKANEFYFERVQKGLDSYNSFSPQDILNVKENKLNRQSNLKSEIKANFALFNMKKVRQISNIYFKDYGIFDRIFIYYLCSFLGRRLIKLVYKVLPIGVLRKMNE